MSSSSAMASTIRPEMPVSTSETAGIENCEVVALTTVTAMSEPIHTTYSSTMASPIQRKPRR